MDYLLPFFIHGIKTGRQNMGRITCPQLFLLQTCNMSLSSFSFFTFCISLHASLQEEFSVISKVPLPFRWFFCSKLSFISPPFIPFYYLSLFNNSNLGQD